MSLLETGPLLRDRALMVHVSMGFDIEAAKPARGGFTLGFRRIVPMDSMGWGLRPRLDIFL